MDQLTPSLLALLDPFAPFFRAEVFSMFRLMVGAWIVCLGRRSISRVWETTGQAGKRNHASAFRFFSAAAWNWDEVCTALISLILVYLIPGATLWVAIDDTLCHKRGAKVAFGGVFLDAVLSTRKHKVFRFGNNWVMLGIVVRLPFRPDRYYCLPVLWRVYEKKGHKKNGAHQTKSCLAAEIVAVLAASVSSKKIIVVGDCAYIGKNLLQDRPKNVDVIGPIRWDAALTEPLEEHSAGRRKKGDRLPTPAEILQDDKRWPAETMTLRFPKGPRTLEVKTIKDVCWYTAAGQERLQLVLVRDPEGQWRDEALVCTDLDLSAADIITGYCRRWSVEVAFCDAKQLLGFHDPQVWCEKSVERAAPMSWFIGSLVVVWYTVSGRGGAQARRTCPWYTNKPEPTFADMLATCRFALWTHWFTEGCPSDADLGVRIVWLLEYIATSD